MMKELHRYKGREVIIMYLDRHNQITKRRIRIRSVDSSRFQAYCFERCAPRVFAIDRVLAVFPATGIAAEA